MVPWTLGKYWEAFTLDRRCARVNSWARPISCYNDSSRTDPKGDRNVDHGLTFSSVPAAVHRRRVWIVDVHKQIVEQHTNPKAGENTQHAATMLGSRLQATQLPNLTLITDRIFS